MKIFVSPFCRAEIPQDFLDTIDTPGTHEIPVNVMAPRQIKLVSEDIAVPATLKWHRDAFIPTISRDTANKLVTKMRAVHCKQHLLVYSIDDYIEDRDVSDKQRTEAVSSGADLVVIAVIGDSRSTLSVCRNIVSGVQNIPTLMSDAEGAIEAASVILIE